MARWSGCVGVVRRKRRRAKMSDAKFKVGDRVRVVSLPGPGWSMEVGQEFVVSLIDYRGAHMTVMYGTHFIPLDCIEPAAEAKVPERSPCGCAPGCLGYVCGFKVMTTVVAQPAAKVDPYEQHRLKWNDAGVRGLVDGADKQFGRRDRLLAALKAEQVDHAKKFTPRFPPESRSDRVYRSNDK